MSTDTAAHLEPCPFCGTTEGLYPSYRGMGSGKPYQIDCCGCGCGIDFTPRDGMDVVAAWNRRASALPAAPMPGVKEEHIERARRIVQGRGFNRPNDIPGERIVGFAVPEDVAGLSEALFALDAIRSAILHAPRLSALDVPAHPEGVKATRDAVCSHGIRWPWGCHDCDAAALSHPEPVAQEAASDFHALRTRVFKETMTTLGFAHPSPSPEQGEDGLVQRLRMGVMVAGESPIGSELYDIDAAETTMDEAATAISALRARVAELEALATPQAGSSEAGPVAGLCPRCAGSGREPNARDLQCSKCMGTGAVVIATPPDSDAVRAMREALHSSVCLLETMAETAKEVGDIANWSLMSVMAEQGRAALSNQGSSSNGQ